MHLCTFVVACTATQRQKKWPNTDRGRVVLLTQRPDSPARLRRPRIDTIACGFCRRPLWSRMSASHRPAPLEPCFEAIMCLEKDRGTWASGCKTLETPAQTFLEHVCSHFFHSRKRVPLARCVSEVRPLRTPKNSSHSSSQDTLFGQQAC